MKQAILIAIALCATLFVAGCQCGPANCGAPHGNQRVWMTPNSKFGPGIVTHGSVVFPIPEQPSAFGNPQ